MSRRQEIQLTSEELAAFLAKPHKAALATVDKDGFPHVVAMGYGYRDGAIYMTSYGKAQKVLNARRNPKVGVMIEVGDRYSEYVGVMMRGTCEVIDDPQMVRDAMRAAGGAASGAGVPSGAASSAPKRVVLKITPHKIASWNHSKLGGRY